MMMTTQVHGTDALPPGDLAEAIKAATREVFSTMLNLEIAPGDVFVEKGEAAPASGVVSIIGLAGVWVGSGSLSCSAKFACQMAAHLLLTEYEAVDEDVLDAVAEITNMIIGNVKTGIEDRLGPMGLSTPTVIYGRNFQTRGARHQEWTVVPFVLGNERMCVQMCIAPNPDAGQRSMRAGFPIPHVLNV